MISSDTNPIVSDGTGGQRISVIISKLLIPNYISITSSQFQHLGPQTRAILTWSSVIGQTYRIQSSPNLQDWTTVSGEMLAIKQSTTSDWTSGLSGQWFRIVA